MNQIDHHPEKNGAEIRVATLPATQLCRVCRCNLIGRPVLRRVQDAVLIVRCPNCDSANSADAYPLAGPWSARWRLAAMIAWLVLVFALFVGTISSMAAFAFDFSDIGTSRLSSEIDRSYQTNLRQKYEGDATTIFNKRYDLAEFGSWWNTAGREAYAASARNWWDSRYVWEFLLGWSPLVIIYFGVGCLWAVILIGQGLAKRMWVTAAFLVAVAVIFWPIQLADQSAFNMITTSWSVARSLVMPAVFPLTIATIWIPLAAGVLVGRPIVRSILRVLLPPALRVPLRGLWTADGKELPGVPRGPA